LGFEFHEGFGCIRYERFIILDAIIGCIGMKFMGTRVVQKSGTTNRTISNGSDFTRTRGGTRQSAGISINDNRVLVLIIHGRCVPQGDGALPLIIVARYVPHGDGAIRLIVLTRCVPHGDGVTPLIRHTRSGSHGDGSTPLIEPTR
jgi:hypothetical protein